jgi:hypothetical protein
LLHSGVRNIHDIADNTGVGRLRRATGRLVVVSLAALTTTALAVPAAQAKKPVGRPHPHPHTKASKTVATPTPTPTSTPRGAVTASPTPSARPTASPASVAQAIIERPRTRHHVVVVAPVTPAPRPKPSRTALPADPRDHRDDGTLAALATFVHAAKDVRWPAGLLVVIVAFLLAQSSIDRRDPKLRLPPETYEEELDFGLTRLAPEPVRYVDVGIRQVTGPVAATSVSLSEST